MPKRRPGRVLLSVRIDAEVARRARELVVFNAGYPMFLKLGAWVQEAIEAHIAVTEAKLAGGKHDQRRSPPTNSRL